MNARKRNPRQGAALIWCIVTLATLTLFMSLTTFQLVRHRRYLERREHQIQALWLARAGIEKAAAQTLSTAPKTETVDILPLGKVRIDIKQDKDVVRVISEATYPTDRPDGVVREVSRSFRRLEEAGKVRLEPVP